MEGDAVDRVEKQLEKLDKRIDHYERMYADAVATKNHSMIVECLLYIRANQKAKIHLLTELVVAMGRAAAKLNEGKEIPSDG